MIRANSEVVFEDEEERDQEFKEDCDESPYDGEVLVFLRALNSQAFSDEPIKKMKNIFLYKVQHQYCLQCDHTLWKNWSCTNVASIILGGKIGAADN